jgi:hypothetical protein
MLPPGRGRGIYCGNFVAIPPILFPISSNGLTAASTALLTHFAAMNDIQMNIRAMISIIIVPKIPPAVLNAPLIVLAEEALALMFVDSPRNTIFIPAIETTSVTIEVCQFV